MINGNTSASSAGLSAKDMEWFSTKKNLKIGYTDNTLPYSDYDEQEEQLVGLLTTFLRHMKERYDVELEPVEYDSYEAVSAALFHGEVDTIFPAYGSYWIFEENDLMVTGALTSSYLMMVYQGVYDETTPSVMSMLEKSRMQQV